MTYNLSRATRTIVTCININCQQNCWRGATVNRPISSTLLQINLIVSMEDQIVL